MPRITLLETAHQIAAKQLDPSGIAIDATLGNGHDSLFLAQCLGQGGLLYGFDIQQQAVTNSLLKLQQHGLKHRAILFHACHADMLTWIPVKHHGQVQAVMFNLGYLPGASKHLITQAITTLAALEAASRLLADQAVITVLAYPGHTGGDIETQAISEWSLAIAKLPYFDVDILLSEKHQAAAPRLFVIRKSKNS